MDLIKTYSVHAKYKVPVNKVHGFRRKRNKGGLRNKLYNNSLCSEWTEVQWIVNATDEIEIKQLLQNHIAMKLRKGFGSEYFQLEIISVEEL